MLRVAVVQRPPAVLNLREGVDRAVSAIDEAAASGARVIAFPETWLTGYPAWVFAMAGWDDSEARRWYRELLRQSPTIDSPDLDPVRAAARKHGVTVTIGMNERAGARSGTIYNTLLTIGSGGQTLGAHRKLTPTHTEKIIWAPSPDAAELGVVDADGVALGGLVCWEHWNPLIRQAMHGLYEQIHVAAWPDMTDAHDAASRTYAFEGRCYVLVAAQYVTSDDVPAQVRDAYRAGVGPDAPEHGVWFAGGSGVVGPDGRWLAEPLFDQSAVIVADVDLDLVDAFKHDLDVSGHYARPDIFTFTVDRRPRQAVVWEDEAPTGDRGVRDEG